MSSIPGYTLEKFLMWQFGVTVSGDATANPSLQIAEALGNIPRRRDLSNAEFAPIVAIFEPYRNQVENALHDFDHDSQSWRDYASYSFDFIPDAEYEKANAALRGGQ